MTGKRTETAGEKVTDNNIHRAKCLERMIMTMNKVILMGRLTKNPEIKYAGKDNDMAVARYAYHFECLDSPFLSFFGRDG